MAITEFKYSPTNWNTNEAITPSRLNKIEQGLYKVGNILKEISESLEDLDNKISNVKGDIAEKLNTAVADAKIETEKIIVNYDKTIAAVIADYKSDMDNRFIALDDYKTEVISAGTAAADNFLTKKGVDVENLKAWRINKEAKDAERDLWQNDVDTWKGDTTTRISNQDALISGIDSIANEAKTTATAAANTATSAANTATTAANNVESKIWAGNQNLTNSFNTLLNGEGARSIISKATNQKLGTVFGLTVNEDDDVDMTALQTQLQNFAGSTLLTANIITDTTEGNQTLTQWLNNKQTAENDSFSAIINTLNQLTQDVADIKTKFNQHASNSTAHTSAGNLFEQVSTPGKVVYTPIGGFTPTITGKK